MSARSQFFYKVWHVLAWVIFLGLCIEAGGIVFNTAFTLFINPLGASNFWEGLDLSALYKFSEGRYVTVTVLMCIVSCLKAIMFYQIVSLFHRKKLDLKHPFSEAMKGCIELIAYVALGVAFFGFWGEAVVRKIMEEGVSMPYVGELKFGGADVWLFMGVVLLIFSSIFKRGIELQKENDLTV